MYIDYQYSLYSEKWGAGVKGTPVLHYSVEGYTLNFKGVCVRIIKSNCIMKLFNDHKSYFFNLQPDVVDINYFDILNL